jgi:VIT1/CCC1 family predicted Fe2+/Mn2+ transporter
VPGLFCGFTRCYRNDRLKTAPGPDPLPALLTTSFAALSNKFKSPLQAALASGAAFTSGGILLLLFTVFAPATNTEY